MSKELKTIWQDNEWKMYASEDGNNPNLPNALITIPEISTITSNPTYIKYANKQITNAHNAAQKKKRVKQHEPGYHRRMIATFLTLFIGLVGLSISSTSVITGQSLTMAIIGLTISIPLFIAGLSLALATLKIQDKFNREKEQYKILVN